MVIGREALHRRMLRIPKNIERAARAEMEKHAARIVAHMRNLNDQPAITIDWIWGGAPKGSLRLGGVGASADDLRITIYARAKTEKYPGGFNAIARWWEFGTGPRFHRKTKRYVGRIEASPYFFPAWRSGRGPAKRAIKRAITKAFKES